MKTIIIERVRNGWIIRPFTPGPDWACSDRPEIAVYNEIHRLQADLPELLGFAVDPGFPVCTTTDWDNKTCGLKQKTT